MALISAYNWERATYFSNIDNHKYLSYANKLRSHVKTSHLYAPVFQCFC